MHNIEQFWCGNEATLQHYLHALKIRETRPHMAAVSSANFSDSQPAAEAKLPQLLSKVGDVGVVTVYGPLVNDDSPWNKFDGLTGYPDIRAALVHAASDPSIKGILLDINSGGGAVSGVSDTADLIASINKSVKPVHTFSDGMIGSAAYWLGSSARSVTIGKVTEAGSIGVLTVHMERSKMMAEAGIGVTVIRAGEFKALGNQFEKLSDPAKADIQAQLDQMYTIFAGHVADKRKVDYAVADQKMGQGRVFMGAAAVAVGLADSISSFDAVLSKLQGAIDSSKKTSQYGTNLTNGVVVKTALTEQQVAALAEAGTVATTPLAQLTPAQKLLADAAAGAIADAEKATADAAAVAAVAATVTAPAIDLNVFLKASLAEAQAANLELTFQLRDAKAGSTSAASDLAALRDYAEAAGNRIKIALGASAGGSETLSATALVAENNALRAQFEKSFSAGGVASTTADKKAEVTDSVRQARLASTRTAK